MRTLATLLSLLVVLAVPTRTWASAGLPQIASLQVGPYRVQIWNDSPSLRTWDNTVTLAVPDLPNGGQVYLALQSPAGRTVAVPLQPLRVLDGPDTAGHGDGPDTTGNDNHAGQEADAHGHDGAGEADGHGHDSAAQADAHGHDSAAETDAHGHGGDGHDEAQSGHHGGSLPVGGYLARGRVKLDQPGTWQLTVTVTGDPAGKQAATIPVTVVDGSPNRVYLGATGLIMTGTVLYGALHRRRRSGFVPMKGGNQSDA
jgi:hypothetical protein